MSGQAPGLIDVATLRSQARDHIENGAVTAGYRADRDHVLQLLSEALATEIVCVLRYRRHHFMASGIHGKSVGAELLVHSNEEQGHADCWRRASCSWAASRISRLTSWAAAAMPSRWQATRCRR